MPDAISIREAASKNYVDNLINDPSLIKNTTHFEFIEKNLDNLHSNKVNSFPTLEDHSTPKIYVNQAISEGVNDSTFLRLDPDEKLDEQNSIFLISSLKLPKTIIKLAKKSYVDRRLKNPSIFRNNIHVDFIDKIFDNVRFVKVNIMPAAREHLTSKLYVDQPFFLMLMNYHCQE